MLPIELFDIFTISFKNDQINMSLFHMFFVKILNNFRILSGITHITLLPIEFFWYFYNFFEK